MTTNADLVRTVPEPVGATISVTPVDYDLDGTALEGLLGKDTAATGRRPGILVVHDWFGVNEHMAARVTMLARLGFVAFAPDIYGKGVRPGPHEAATVAGGFYQDLPLMRARAEAGLERLVADPDVDPDRIVVMGYCFGGTVALELARTGAALAGAVSFHGNPLAHDPSDADAIRARLLVLAGGADPVVPDETLAAFANELRSVPAVDWQIVSYANAMHAFAVPDANTPEYGAQYNELADRRSWRALLDFLGEVFDEETAAA